MSHGLLLTLHLLAAIAFAGTVFFEVGPRHRCGPR